MSEQHSSAAWQLQPLWSLDLCPVLLQVGISVLQPKHQTSAEENRTESVQQTKQHRNSPEVPDLSRQAPGYTINHKAGWLVGWHGKLGSTDTS